MKASLPQRFLVTAIASFLSPLSSRRRKWEVLAELRGSFNEGQAGSSVSYVAQAPMQIHMQKLRRNEDLQSDFCHQDDQIPSESKTSSFW